MSENWAFIRKSEYYNNHYGNRKNIFRPQQSSFIITNQYLPPDEVQNVHVPCKTYNLKIVHFIKTNALKNKVRVNADLTKIT